MKQILIAAFFMLSFAQICFAENEVPRFELIVYVYDTKNGITDYYTVDVLEEKGLPNDTDLGKLGDSKDTSNDYYETKIWEKFSDAKDNSPKLDKYFNQYKKSAQSYVDSESENSDSVLWNLDYFNLQYWINQSYYQMMVVSNNSKTTVLRGTSRKEITENSIRWLINYQQTGN